MKSQALAVVTPKIDPKKQIEFVNLLYGSLFPISFVERTKKIQNSEEKMKVFFFMFEILSFLFNQLFF